VGSNPRTPLVLAAILPLVTVPILFTTPSNALVLVLVYCMKNQLIDAHCPRSYSTTTNFATESKVTTSPRRLHTAPSPRQLFVHRPYRRSYDPVHPAPGQAAQAHANLALKFFLEGYAHNRLAPDPSRPHPGRHSSRWPGRARHRRRTSLSALACPG